MTQDATRDGTAPAAAVRLRRVETSDLAVLFEHQRDREANRMAAFGPKDPDDRAAFDARWERIASDPTIAVRAIVVDGEVAGSILLWRDPAMAGPEVSYWLGRKFWGRGIATAALERFLELATERPLFGRAVADNAGSLRVLEKCGFVRIGEGSGYSDSRAIDVTEVILRLDH